MKLFCSDSHKTQKIVIITIINDLQVICYFMHNLVLSHTLMFYM